MGNGIDRASSTDLSAVGSTDWPYPTLIAHRCGGTLAPENTLAGFDACVRYGYRMVEFDAKLSADNQLFLLHDDLLERTTNAQGAAATQAWSQLATLDAGSWFDASFAGTRLPTLAEAAARCARDGIAANIEIKPCAGRDEITGRLVANGAASLWQGQTAPLLSSFSFDALAAARDAAPHLRRGMLFEDVPAEWLRIVRELDCVSLHADHASLSEPLVAEIHAAGLRVLAYTVNDPERARLLAQWGVDMICTDRLDRLHHDMFAD
ncbi:glycerophosphodiester phosphodiesterase [Paraburkholderia sp. BCC1886]|uniref:glycerophosphodiester phosphodiesterase n=1 Tax=Paraburkholderia sp. BCC1886 TaxID=2562670 RepID=UPI001181FCE6|nr:glycerophosphodiester phosphodiesterase [Paraburkholderia sp. BCC1886]